MKKEWTVDNTETLRRLTTQMRRPDGRIDWQGLLNTREGQQLLKGRNVKAVMNQYTWRLSKHANMPAPTQPPAPVPLAATANGRWTPEEEAELARLVNKYTYGKGVGWKRMQVEEPEAIARLTANRPMSTLRQKYLKGPGSQRKTYRKGRAVETEPQQEQAAAPLPSFCYNCGAHLTPVNKGLAVYHNLKRR